jgi:AraC family transcriptional regulator of adaptative response/methylated-DNA-[protein]-cysteine methyltransferase
MSEARSRIEEPGMSTELRYTYLSMPVGRLLLVISPRGIRALWLAQSGDDDALLAKLRKKHRATLIEDRQLANEWRPQIEDVVAGKRRGTELKLDPVGTPFQLKVWRAICAIPYGQTRTYADIAKKVGSPRAVRAVGQACGANPIGLLVPCHRVVRQGELGGYYWGSDRKQTLLELERTAATAEVS